MPIIVVCRKMATICFLEIGLELLFYAMPQARTVWQPNSAQRHVIWGTSAPEQGGLYCEGPRTSFDSSGSHKLPWQISWLSEVLLLPASQTGARQH